MNQAIVSIIVPVYNAQRDLERCLNSILNQTYQHFEVVMVDDGSTDDSPGICDTFARNDARFKVYHQPNQGPSAARNQGLKLITGDYLCCLDADDMLREDALEQLVHKMESTNADVCIFAWRFIYENGDITEFHFADDDLIASIDEIYQRLMQGNYKCGGGNPWNKIWRLDKQKPLNGMDLFDERICIYEDMLWVIQNLENVRRVVFEKSCLYDYYILNDSISRKGNEVERRKKFYLGAKQVYEYIHVHHPNVEREAQCWYRDRFYFYLKSKFMQKVAIEHAEKEEIKRFSCNPSMFKSFDQWLKFLFIKLIVCRSL